MAASAALTCLSMCLCMCLRWITAWNSSGRTFIPRPSFCGKYSSETVWSPFTTSGQRYASTCDIHDCNGRCLLVVVSSRLPSG